MAIQFPELWTSSNVGSNQFIDLFNNSAPWEEVFRSGIYNSETFGAVVMRSYIEEFITFMKENLAQDDFVLMSARVRVENGSDIRPNIEVYLTPKTGFAVPDTVFCSSTTYFERSNPYCYCINKNERSTNFPGRLFYQYNADPNLTNPFSKTSWTAGQSGRGVEYVREAYVGFYEGLVSNFPSTPTDKGILFSSLGTSGSYVETNPDGTAEATSGRYPSGTLGGTGTFDDSTDEYDFDPVPDFEVSDLGFYSIWNPTNEQVKNLAKVVWNNPAHFSEWPDIFRSGWFKPMEYIVSMGLLPVEFTSEDYSLQPLTLGGVTFDGSWSSAFSSVSVNKLNKQFFEFDFGTIDVNEYFGSSFDYAPYTKVEIYLPYLGNKELSCNEIQNSRLHLKYYIDAFSGVCIIKLKVTKLNKKNGSNELDGVIYQWQTNMMYSVPLSNGANTENMKKIAGLIASVAALGIAPIAGAGAAALGGASAAASAGGSAMTGAKLGLTGTAAANSAVGIAADKMSDSAYNAVRSAPGKVMNAMPAGSGINRGGNASCELGGLSQQTPALFITRPIQVRPQDFKRYAGDVSNITMKLSDVSGFYIVDEIHPVGIKTAGGMNASDSEIALLESILHGGVVG